MISCLVNGPEAGSSRGASNRGFFGRFGRLDERPLIYCSKQNAHAWFELNNSLYHKDMEIGVFPRYS